MATTTKWPIEEVIRKGTRLAGLIVTHRPRLEPRVESGGIDGYLTDIGEMRGVVDAVGAIRATKLGSTKSQEEAAEEGASIISAHREALKGTYKQGSPLRKTFGVGTKVDPSAVATVATALFTLFDAAAKQPDAARAAGILPEDEAEMRSIYTALVGSEEAQETMKGTSKGATAARVARHARVEATMTRIVGISAVVFRKEPQIAQQFADCLPTTRKPTKKTKGKASPTP